MRLAAILLLALAAPALAGESAYTATWQNVMRQGGMVYGSLVLTDATRTMPTCRVECQLREPGDAGQVKALTAARIAIATADYQESLKPVVPPANKDEALAALADALDTVGASIKKLAPTNATRIAVEAALKAASTQAVRMGGRPVAGLTAEVIEP